MPNARMSREDRVAKLNKILETVLPELVPLLAESTHVKLHPVDSTTVTGAQLRLMMNAVGGSYLVMSELIEPADDYQISFGFLNLLITQGTAGNSPIPS